MATPTTSAPTTGVKEVDYYLNPTELFRWINYRRWDGARSRAQSHPDECCTWIVSRHNTDGRILWRHLPLHLICMQKEAAQGVLDESDVQSVVASRQMEQLMDVLLDSYPEGASSPDDQGMLPLHLLLSKAEGEPNDRVINLLLSSFPNAVDIRDKFGRTPNDILRESCDAAADGGGGQQTSDRCRAAFRALKRARFVADRITATIRDESANIVAAVQHEASNERGASQKIIIRLEEELSTTQKDFEARDAREREVLSQIAQMKHQLGSSERQLNETMKNLEITKKERDELLLGNESMKSNLDSHNEIVERIRKDAESGRESDNEVITRLKSEVSTAKAMTEALESQLRTRFTNEEYMSTTVSDLEEQLEELKVRHEHSTKKHTHEMDALSADNKRLKFNVDDLTKKNAQLQEKLKELHKQTASIISSYAALNSEHDRLQELSQTYECGLLESVRTERAHLVEHFNKQREVLEKTFMEQERIIQASLQSQDQLVANAKADRVRGKGTVEKLRNEFQQLRAEAAERERMIHAEELAANRKMKRNNGLITQSPSSSSSTRRGESESIASSSPGGGGESRDPYPSHSHHRSPPPRPPRTVHPTSSSNSSTTDGHLVRLLDERAAAAQRDHGMSVANSSTSDSSTQPQYYKVAQHQQQHHHHHQQQHSSSPGKHHHSSSPGKYHYPSSSSPMRRPPLDRSAYSNRVGEGRHSLGGEGYSLEQYSQDASESTGRYSEIDDRSSTSYSESDPPRRHSIGAASAAGGDPPSSHIYQQHSPQQHPWRHSQSLPYTDESING